MKNIYKITMYGYGGEVVLGHVKREIYDYFKKHELDLERFVYDEDYRSNVTEDMKPFDDGNWYDCDNIAHNCGVELADGCFIEVGDSTGKVIWKSDLDISTLVGEGCEVDNSEEHYAGDYPKGNIVFFGQEFEKGGFFETDVEVEGKFNKRKLKFTTIDIEGFVTLRSLEYDGEELNGTGGYGTTGKSCTYIFIESQSTQNHRPHGYKDSQLAEWCPSDVNPVHLGVYEIEFSTGRIGSIFANWNGVQWTNIDEPSKRINQSEISQWRGLKK